MRTRALWLCVGALACGACAFHDHHQACTSAGDCGLGEQCFQGFCVRADASSEVAVSRSEQGHAGAASGAGNSGQRAGAGTGARSPSSPSDGAGGSSSAAAGGTAADGGSGSSTTPAAIGGGSSAGSGPPGGAADGGDNSSSGGAMSSVPSGGSAAPPPSCQPRPEECNGADDDCDGRIDEQTDGDCYPDGQPGCTLGSDGRWTCTGTCALGKRACSAGKLQDCASYKLPSAEVCTPSGMLAADEDCNGATDETCACASGDVSSCYDGRAGTRDVGKCKAGTQTCADGKLGACMGQVTPGVEDCSNMNSDDDCDGALDNVPSLGSVCVVAGAAGSCRSGKLQCDGGAARCVGEAAHPETCNGMDDDCNGQIDDGFDLQRDTNNCGQCGNKCRGEEVCGQGKCTQPATDPTTPPSQPTGPSTPQGCSPACGSGQTCCGNTCVDTRTDAHNCGACNNACGSGNQPGCCGGKCVDLISNQNCGSCGHDCSLLTNSGLTCSCNMSGNGQIACVGPVLDICL